MDIRLFVAILFSFSLLSLVEVNKTDLEAIKSKDVPLVKFIDAKMYTLNHKEVTRMVETKEAARYKSRDEMIDGTIVTRFEDENKNSIKDKINANKIVSQDDLYSFYGDVKFDREKLFSIQTQELFYDLKKEIAYNDVDFKSLYKGDILYGNKLYIDNLKGIRNANNSHFEIDVAKPDETK